MNENHLLLVLPGRGKGCAKRAHGPLLADDPNRGSVWLRERRHCDALCCTLTQRAKCSVCCGRACNGARKTPAAGKKRRASRLAWFRADSRNGTTRIEACKAMQTNNQPGGHRLLLGGAAFVKFDGGRDSSVRASWVQCTCIRTQHAATKFGVSFLVCAEFEPTAISEPADLFHCAVADLAGRRCQGTIGCCSWLMASAVWSFLFSCRLNFAPAFPLCIVDLLRFGC